jgi:glycosyltransferase involved in cell wall biosynthesis
MSSPASPSGEPVSVLYVVYWGAAEPLGRSLVLPTIERLAGKGLRVTLMTFEKTADLRSTREIGPIAVRLRERGVTWIRLRYHKWPRVPATLWDIVQGCWWGVVSRLRHRYHLVHARTFVGGLIGLVLAPVLRAKLVFHAEGFYPEEQVDSGVWRAGSLPHRLGTALERLMFGRADANIVLSSRARDVISRLPAVAGRRTPILVVPSCVDLERFSERKDLRPEPSGPLRLVYMGSVGRRYRIESIARLARAAATAGPVLLTILSWALRDEVAPALAEAGLTGEDWCLKAVPHAAVGAELSHHDAGLHFIEAGRGGAGGSPTKIGEYWAAGLPAVVNAGVGDTEDIIRKHGVGVIVEGDSEQALLSAAKDLRVLVQDAALGNRCRWAAEEYCSLAKACEAQLALYRTLVLPPRAPAVTN